MKQENGDGHACENIADILEGKDYTPCEAVTGREK